MNQEQVLEQEIQTAGLNDALRASSLNSPRITPEHIDSTIASADYYVFPNTTLTVCCIHLKNGFNVTGESACVSSVNFNEELGKKLAYDNAKEKIWQLEGYLLNIIVKASQELAAMNRMQRPLGPLDS